MPFVVVGTQCFFVMLVYHLWVLTAVHGGHLTCLCCSFPGMTWLPTGGRPFPWGRGDMEGASCQPPVGSQWWWCCVSGVSGNRCGGVAYCIHYKRKQQCCHRCCPLSVCIAWLPHCIQQRGLAHLWGCSWLWGHGVWFSWVLVIMCQLLPLLCVVVIVVRRLWPFVGQLLSFVGLWQLFVGLWQLFVGWWQLFVGWLSSFGGQGCLQWWWWWLGVEE